MIAKANAQEAVGRESSSPAFGGKNYERWSGSTGTQCSTERHHHRPGKSRLLLCPHASNISSPDKGNMMHFTEALAGVHVVRTVSRELQVIHRIFFMNTRLNPASSRRPVSR